MNPASPDQQKIFIDYLDKLGVEYSLRRSFGQDISAACGQLATV
jgi:adenine C2-methylase RlmN of 23S rRNA A2503 and tRNA A37